MKKLLLISAIAAITCGTSVYAQDAPPPDVQGPCPIERCEKPGPEMIIPDRMHRPPHFDMKKFEDELNLTEKQKAQLKTLREKRMEASKPIFEKLKAKEKEAAELRTELRDLRMQGKKDFESVLTEKQLKKFEQLKNECRHELVKRHKHDMHRRPPMMIECRCNCPCNKPVQE